MSRLAEFRKLEQQLAEQLAELESLKSDAGLQKEIEFESKLRALLAAHNYSLRDVVAILDPGAVHRKAQPTLPVGKVTRKARVVKQYKNPHNGEMVETKGGNHRTLKAWKAEFGGAEVESWRSN